jgi:autotransporter-associated beta strand protein
MPFFDTNQVKPIIPMKKTTRIPTLLLGATLLGTILSPNPAAADVVLQTLSQGLGTNWNQATWGTPPAVPSSPNDYVTPLGFDARTPDSQTASAFLGNSLQIEAGGRLLLKNGGAGNGVATANLILNGGSITYNTANGTTISAVAGTLQVLTDSTINSVAGGNTRDVWLRSTLSGSGGLTVGMVNNALVLYGTNSAYTGNWTVNAGRIELGSDSLHPLGAGSVNLINPGNALTCNATNDLTVTNAISGSGLVVKLNTNTVTWSGDNSGFFGTVAVSNGVLRVQNATAIANAMVITLAGGTLDATPMGGLLLNDAMAQSLNSPGIGTVAGNLTAPTGTTLNFNLPPATNDLLNVTGTLTLNGNPTVNLTFTGFKPAGTYRLINYSGSIQGGGSFNLVPASSGNQTFTLDTATPGQVNLVISGIPNNLTWVGDGFGKSWDTFSPNWTNPAAVQYYVEGDNVTFNDSGSAVPDIFIAATVSPSSVTVSNSAQPYTISGAGISTVGALTKQGDNVLAFTSDANQFSGTVTIEGGALSIGNGGDTGNLGSANIVNNGELRMNKLNNGVLLTGIISGAGSVRATGGGGSSALMLMGTNTYTGLTTVENGTELHVRNDSALGNTSAGTLVLTGGSVKFTTLGNWTVAEPLTLNGSGATFPGALYVNTISNRATWTGPITLGSASRIRVVNDYASLTIANTVTGDQTPLQCSTEGNGPVLTFQNNVTIGNAAELSKDGSGTTLLNGANNQAGSTVINGGTLLVNGQLDGGPVTVNASATVGGAGTIVGSVSVQGGATVSPGNAGIGTLTLNSTLTMAPTTVTVMEINRTNAQNADLLVAPAVPFNGTLTVVNTGPTLQVGDTFNLFDGTLSGVFSATNLPALALPSHAWSTSNLLSQGTITVISNALPLLPLVITEVKPQSGSVLLTWNSYPGKFYTVEYSLNLTNWSPLKSDLPGNAETNRTTAAVDITGAGSGANNTLVQYRMGTVNAQIQDAGNLMAAGSLLNGGGLSLFNANANVGPAYPNAPQLQVSPPNFTTTLDLAVANTSWFTFELTVGTNLTDLDLTSLTFNGARGGGAAPRGYGVYVSTPTTTDELVQGSTAFATQRPTWSFQNISLAGFASLQNLTSGQVVTFKIPIFAPAAANSVEIDDITVIGNITPGPVPPYVGADRLFLRIKQQ